MPGTSTTYTIVVSNAGPARRHRRHPLRPPAGRRHRRHLDVRRRQTGGGGVTGPTQRQRALSTTVNLPVGATVTFSFTATIDPTATGILTNIATVTPPGDADQRQRHRRADAPGRPVGHQDRRQGCAAVPGTPDTYTITVSNAGPSTVSSVTLTDAVPAALLNPVFGTPSAGSYNPATGVWSGLSLAAGQSVTITLTGTIDPAASGSSPTPPTSPRRLA